MKEYGSDFHKLDGFYGKPADIEKLRPVNLADGRMAIQWLILNERWKRMWIPAYFCYDVVDAIRKTDIELAFYPDYPEADDNELIAGIPFRKGDVLFRMNYFGIRAKRNENDIPVDVIEDHSHGLMTDWAQHSNAGYCIASLRKTLPLPEGGIIWSPKCTIMQQPLPSTDENESLAYKRYVAMSLKRDYLDGKDSNKSFFRQLYIDTENEFANLPVCAMSALNEHLFSIFDIQRFDVQKRRNWRCLTSLLDERIDFLVPENEDDIPFSLVLKFKSEERRNAIKTKLIEKLIYPAILWPVPERYKLIHYVYLSVHCDGRYTLDDMEKLAVNINNAYRNE